MTWLGYLAGKSQTTRGKVSYLEADGSQTADNVFEPAIDVTV